MKWKLILIMALMMIPLATAIIDCAGIMNKGDLPCLIISPAPLTCAAETIKVYNEIPTLLRTAQLADYADTSRCNITFGINSSETTIGSYLLNWSSGDSSKIIIEEDNNMLIALVIGVSLIVALFVILTLDTKEDKPFLANFFFLGIFIFTTVLSFLLWKITNVNSSPYEPIMYTVYYIFLVITMVMMLIVLTLVTIDVIQVRKIAGNPIDTYRDNLGKDEKSKF